MHSICYALAKYDANVKFVSPLELTIPTTDLSDIRSSGCNIAFVETVEEALSDSDVIYMEPVVQADYGASRVERSGEGSRTSERYRIDLEKLRKYARPDAMVLHSLPRMDELDTDVDQSEFASYWDEAEMGVHLRKALLDLILSED